MLFFCNKPNKPNKSIEIKLHKIKTVSDDFLKDTGYEEKTCMNHRKVQKELGAAKMQHYALFLVMQLNQPLLWAHLTR